MIIIDVECWTMVYCPKTKKKLTADPIYLPKGNVLISNADADGIKFDVYMGETEQKCRDKETELSLID